jgi:hypothetical protein
MNNLNESLRKTALEFIASINLLDVNSFARRNAATLRQLISLGIIDDSQIDAALDRAIINRAREDYSYLLSIKMRDGSVEAFHNCVTEYLAYALVKGNVFSPEERAKMSFTDINARTADEFQRYYHQPNLLERLKISIINPSAPLKSESALRCADGGPCTCC